MSAVTTLSPVQRNARRAVRVIFTTGKALGMLGFLLGLIAGGGALLWYQGGRLTDNDATLQQKIADDPVPRGERDADPFGPRVRSVDDARLNALIAYNFGLLILLGGGAGVIAWCSETRDALSRRRQGGGKA